MTPLDALSATGTALHGARWRAPLARQIRRPGTAEAGVSLRLLQLWQSGDRPTPDWLKASLADILRSAARERAVALEKLATKIIR